ncbi:MAG TPA: serine hydrolase domain-containing protein [Vicinamibacterales bacterium]|nr:serine hydrolase domain-containing protein [Vicinamibacterales bacterium]
MKRTNVLFAAAVAVAAGSLAFGQSATRPASDSTVDAVFARWTASTPGCAVGVGRDGRVALARAYGMADLERDVPNTADTIFEAGSVSKQFTAAAVLLLARDGKLSLDDPVRKYVPELPDYGPDRTITIRHMLTHTSGLRDWGEVAGLAGWPRGRRVHTHAHVLDIVSRQKGLNFAPGTNWSYSNTGYNLAAILVARVSGQSFAEFSRDRIFTPLGMTRTSWRDDYTRIVRNRAIAYAPSPAGYREDMPFENVHGNGGLLTTVGDLLRWNENFASPTIGDLRLVTAQQTPGTFADGRAHEYALGLYVRTYRGVREVSHSGATAGYRAFLVRYPDQRLSIAVLCNAGSANPTQYAHAVAETYLGAALTAPPPATASNGRGVQSPPFSPAKPDVDAYVGRYRSDEAEAELAVALDGSELIIKRRPDTVLRMRPIARDVFSVPSLGTVTFHRTGNAVTDLGVKLDRVWDLRFARIP